MEWISVKKALPEEGELVLTIDSRESLEQYRVDYIIKFENIEEPYIWAYRLCDDWEDVTHWMPLPKPPK